MAEDFDVSKYLQGISVGAPDSSFDSDGFNTDLFGSSSGSGFNDEGFNIDFLNDLTSGNISNSDNFDSSGFNTSYMDRLLGNDKKSSAFDAENLFAALTGAASSSKKDDKNLLQRAASKIFGAKGDKSPGTLEMLALLAGTSLMKDRGMMNPDVPVVGYQGEIPKYQAIQEQVTGRDDSNRRPGSGGRRYMSDVIYAKAPENQEPMSVAEAKAKAKAQAQGFAEGGDVATFLQGLGGGQGAGGYESLIQSMQPQGRAAPQRMQTAPAQPAPMPMPAPSGGMGGLDMLTLAALLQGQQGGGAQPQAQPQQALPPGVAPGGKYYDFNGTPMYQPPMPTAAPGQFIAQVMPTPIDLTTGKPQDNSIGGGFNDRSGGVSERLREAMKGKMPTPATDTVGTSGYKRGKGDMLQKSSPPVRAGSPVKMPGERAPDRPTPIPDMLKKMGEISPMQSKPAPRRAPTPPMDYSKILESLGGIGGIGMAEGGYLNGDSDGQADKIPGSIDGVQEARLSHGEYVLPADLVSLLGNGNSDAGAKALDDFMAMVRKQGTGTEKQQKNIKADKVLASLMQGKG